MARKAGLGRGLDALFADVAPIEEGYNADSLKDLSGTADKKNKDEKAATDRDRIIYIDINRFKSVNDRYGHSVGNEVLQEAAIRLKKASQYNVFRIGGDEFAILVDERIGIAEYQDIITNIHYVFSYDILDNDKYKIAVSVSAGYARAPEDSEVPDILREIADNRMYTCKKKMHEEMDKK